MQAKVIAVHDHHARRTRRRGLVLALALALSSTSALADGPTRAYYLLTADNAIAMAVESRPGLTTAVFPVVGLTTAGFTPFGVEYA